LRHEIFFHARLSNVQRRIDEQHERERGHPRLGEKRGGQRALERQRDRRDSQQARDPDRAPHRRKVPHRAQYSAEQHAAEVLRLRLTLNRYIVTSLHRYNVESASPYVKSLKRYIVKW